MGKKSKNKRKKYKYNKTEFMSIICAQCGLCPEGTDPVFCYGDVYKENPRKFIRVIFKNLIEVRRWLVNIGHSDPAFCPDEDIEYIFRMGFCQSNYCKQNSPKKKDCVYLAGCLSAFRKQIKNPMGQVIVLNDHRTDRGRKKKNRRKKKSRKAKNRYVPQPYPTFFCREGMEDEVRRIIDGDKPKQQDPGQEPT